MEAPEMIVAERSPDVKEVHIVWMTLGWDAMAIRFRSRRPRNRAWKMS